MFIIFLNGLNHLACDKKTDNANNVKKDFRNFYGICWDGNYEDNLMYAKQMGYDYVMYQKGMEYSPLSDGFYFYLESPENRTGIFPRELDKTRVYTKEEINVYETFFTWRNQSQFPNNMARGWFFDDNSFSVQFDYQQKKVIDTLIQAILHQVKSIESENPEFKFGGFAWDVSLLSGDFWDTTYAASGTQISLEYWTGGDFGIPHEGIIHDYPTYSEGRKEFYKTIYSETKKMYPNAKFILEPYEVYRRWISKIEEMPDAQKIMPDMIVQEKYGIDFVEDERIFASGLIDRRFIGSTTPDRFGEYENRLYAAKAAIYGAWFGWFGRFGGTGDMPSFENIYDVPARLQLVRMVPVWDNLQNIPLDQRSWDGRVYHSPNSFISNKVISSLQPKTNKLFIVFLDESGSVTIPEGFEIDEVYKTNNMFIETDIVASDVEINNRIISLKSLELLKNGIIIQLK